MANNVDNNLYSEITDSKDNMIAKSKRYIQKYLIYIVLIFNMAVRIVTELYKVGFANPFTVKFILELIISTITTMICYVCFIPFGKKSD